MTGHVAAEPPLDPAGDEARSLLGRELANPEYYDADVVDRLINWLDRLIGDIGGAAESSPPVTVAVAILVALLLAAGVLLIVSRARQTARGERVAAPALTGEVVTAAELRSRAEAALVAGDHGAALVDAFRALAVRQVERDRIDDVPQATAHELATALAGAFAPHAVRIRRAADLFDQVLYGDRPATREQALEVLALDEELAGRKVR
jgi:mRNA-degrading endonuclease toxin of MazEF toxin-antitoxin module